MTQEIFGIKIYVTADLPKMQLSDDCPVTPKFRIEINAWMIEFFGYTNVIPDGQMFKSNGCLFMNPRTNAELKRNSLYDEMQNYNKPEWTSNEPNF